jgi:hypothetical protein
MNFKFLTNSIKENWRKTGLLDHCTNEGQMLRILEITRNYMINTQDNIHNPVLFNIILPIMYGLFHNKRETYLNGQITSKLQEILRYLHSDTVAEYINDIHTNAWTTVDIEAEIVHLTIELYDWNE